MSFSYGSPADSDKDQIRFLLGDTVEADALLTDEEIEWLLTQERNVFLAAALGAEVLAGRYVQEVSVSADGMSFSGKEFSDNYLALSERLRGRSRSSRRFGLPYVGGISWDERRRADADSDKVPTHFRSHMHDNPGVGWVIIGHDPLKGEI